MIEPVDKKENWIAQSSWAMTASLGGFLQFEPSDKCPEKPIQKRLVNSFVIG
jgi:hypothetical protein